MLIYSLEVEAVHSALQTLDEEEADWAPEVAVVHCAMVMQCCEEKQEEVVEEVAALPQAKILEMRSLLLALQVTALCDHSSQAVEVVLRAHLLV